MKRPQATIADVKAMINKSHYSLPIGFPVYVIAIRGYYKNSMGLPGVNDIGIYDDAMFLFGPDFFKSFNGNTDPAKHKFGIATLVPGLHYFKKGMHHIGKPNAYPAFRPATPDESLPVTRWGEKGIFKGIAINLHRGGEWTTSSEGCQTVIEDEWIDFQQTAYKLLDENNQKQLPYLLIEI